MESCYSSSSSSKIVLKSSDGTSFVVDEMVARQSVILKHSIEAVDDSTTTAGAGATTIEIPLPNVTADLLRKVVEYCKAHVDDEYRPKSHDSVAAKQQLRDWDSDFLGRIDYDTLFHLTLAANYMEIPGLFDLCCQSIADSIKDKSVEELREILNIENDYTLEEEIALRKQIEWPFK